MRTLAFTCCALLATVCAYGSEKYGPFPPDPVDGFTSVELGQISELLYIFEHPHIRYQSPLTTSRFKTQRQTQQTAVKKKEQKNKDTQKKSTNE